VFVLLSPTACGGDDDSVPMDAGGPDAPAIPDAGPPPDVPFIPPPPPLSEPGRHDVTVIDTRRVVPSSGLPSEVVAQDANNNLDVVRHSDGRVYLAFRTAPHHFASPDVEMFVVSSADEETWTFETRVDLDQDLREPRFLSLGDSLFLYLARLGTNRLAFEPMGVSITERQSDGTWTPPEVLDLGEPDNIIWRTKVERGTPYMVSYFGGEGIYTGKNPVVVELRTTTDGRSWTPLAGGSLVLDMGGGSETDFALGDDGTLYGIQRNELGDATGWGSKVCSAPASDITDWTCVTDPKKYDSPLMFWHDGEAYLIARRHLTETGHYDISDSDDPLYHTVENQLGYVAVPKRCSLWRWVQGEDRIAYVLDLPSRGDTCFPAWRQGATPEEIIVYNYSNDVDGPDHGWNTGQNEPTYIYRHVLRFEPR
jgi:hypothetical protein